MAIKEKIGHIGTELKNHAPFTIAGAASGIVLMLVFSYFVSSAGQAGRILFGIFHPAHVVLSAMVTASLFQLHRKAKSFILILLIGYIGSIGIATLSDCIIPFFGERILGVAVPLHSEIHTDGDSHTHDITCTEDNCQASQQAEQHTKPEMHLGFVEEWYLVNPAAILGIIIAYFLPHTKFPHAAHILVSTWASSAHILMNTHQNFSIILLAGMFIVLFVAVWLPCCLSDIIFPLLFVKADNKSADSCLCHRCHSHTKQEK